MSTSTEPTTYAASAVSLAIEQRGSSRWWKSRTITSDNCTGGILYRKSRSDGGTKTWSTDMAFDDGRTKRRVKRVRFIKGHPVGRRLSKHPRKRREFVGVVRRKKARREGALTRAKTEPAKAGRGRKGHRES